MAIAYLMDARIYYCATILTYEKTDQNVKDLIPALVSIISLLIAFVTSAVVTFIPQKSSINKLGNSISEN